MHEALPWMHRSPVSLNWILWCILEVSAQIRNSSHPWLHGKSKANLSHARPCFNVDDGADNNDDDDVDNNNDVSKLYYSLRDYSLKHY